MSKAYQKAMRARRRIAALEDPESPVPDNPFKSGTWMGHEMQAVDVQSRLDMVKGFTVEQCEEALWLDAHEHIYLQKTVNTALHRRVRKLVAQDAR